MAIITSLSQKDALPFFKRMVAEAWSDAQGVPNFLRSLTTPKLTTAKAVSIEVERHFRKIAVEVTPGGSPNIHRRGKSTEKQYVPPYFSDAVLMNDLDAYQRVFGDGVGTVSRNDIREMASELIAGMMDLKNLQERAIEKQISDVLVSGVLTTLDGGIDYKRKATSIVTNAGADLWSDVTADALGQLKTDAEFIATQGNSGSARFNVIMGSAVHSAFMNNTALKETADFRYIKLVDLGMPQIQANGATLHGVVSAGAYQFFIWTYPSFYDLGTKSGDLKDTAPYIPADKYIMLSEDVVLKNWKAGVPTVFGNNRPTLGNRPVFNDGWSVHEAISPRAQTHEAIVRVAPLVVPYSIDRIVTRKAV
jgi:hypothetical protein